MPLAPVSECCRRSKGYALTWAVRVNGFICTLNATQTAKQRIVEGIPDDDNPRSRLAHLLNENNEEGDTTDETDEVNGG